MRDAVSLFSCEKDGDITGFIKTKAIEYEKRDKCRTFLYFDDAEFKKTRNFRIIGFFSLAMKTLKVPVIDAMSNTLKKRLGNLSDGEQNLAAFLIGQLGRDTSYSKEALDGKRMLKDCYGLIGSARAIIGGRIILLDCKSTEKLCHYYENEGYIDITENGDGLKHYVRFID